jgi:hypothetical protein
MDWTPELSRTLDCSCISTFCSRKLLITFRFAGSWTSCCRLVADCLQSAGAKARNACIYTSTFTYIFKLWCLITKSSVCASDLKFTVRVSFPCTFPFQHLVHPSCLIALQIGKISNGLVPSRTGRLIDLFSVVSAWQGGLKLVSYLKVMVSFKWCISVLRNCFHKPAFIVQQPLSQWAVRVVGSTVRVDRTKTWTVTTVILLHLSSSSFSISVSYYAKPGITFSLKRRAVALAVKLCLQTAETRVLFRVTSKEIIIVRSGTGTDFFTELFYFPQRIIITLLITAQRGVRWPWPIQYGIIPLSQSVYELYLLPGIVDLGVKGSSVFIFFEKRLERGCRHTSNCII